MLSTAEKLLFAILALVTTGLAIRNFKMVFDIVRRGEPDLTLNDLPGRVWRAVEVFFSQRTVFRTRWQTSLFHGLVAWGFTYYLLVNLGDLLAGFIPGFIFLGSGLIGNLYRLGADLLSVGVLVGMAYLMIRRYLVDGEELTFRENVLLHPKVRSGVRRDSFIVGAFILLHVGFRFLGASFSVADHGVDAWQPFASLAANLWGGLGENGIVIGERIGFWVALGLIFIFLPYFPYTKHLHLMVAPVNYLTRPKRKALGALNALDFEDETREEFGVQRLEQLHQTQILDAFACIMCNRCQDVCPAYVTGKELSPSALEVNKRYLIKAQMAALASGSDSPAPLLGSAISEAALWACTSCAACVEVCPVGNEPMFDILDIRRHQVLTEGSFPHELQSAFNGMERQGNPWQMSSNRMAWAEGLDVPTVEDNPDFEYLYWVGCAASYDPRARKVARAFVTILNQARVNYAVLGQMENCSGDTARRAGYEYLFSEMARANIETLQEVKARKIVATCPHCLHTLGAEYPQFGGDFEVIHHTQLIRGLQVAGKIKANSANGRRVTFHDPCYLGRHNGVYADPRAALQGANLNVVEMTRTRNNSFCCGAGGAQMWKEEEKGDAAVNVTRFAEAQSTGVDTLAVGCPFCLVMLGDANQAAGNTMQVLDVAEIVAGAMME